MNCELRVIPNKEIVVSRSTGPIEISDRYRNLDQTLAFCKERGIYSILVDTRGQVSQSTTLEIVAFAKEVVSRAVGFRIAFVRDPDSGDVQFMGNVATIRDLDCKGFFTFEEAEQWLAPHENPPNQPVGGDI